MAVKSPVFVSSLVKFLAEEISEKKIEYLVPLESKGALLLDLALESVAPDEIRPKILYLRSLEYLPEISRRSSIFGLFDDFVFSGRTISRALKTMRDLGIPRENIHTMAFFKFARRGEDEDVCVDVIAETKVPKDESLPRLSQEEVLKDVQLLAIEHKIPASYDNLHWHMEISHEVYAKLMSEFVKTGWFLHYGHRGKFEASILLIRERSRRSYFSVPKIRLWYDDSQHRLHFSPISFPRARKSTIPQNVENLKEILTPVNPSERQRNFAGLQAEAISEQVYLLGYIKGYLQRFQLSPILDHTQMQRYFGPRSQQVFDYVEKLYQSMAVLEISGTSELNAERIDFYAVAVEIMRLLGKVYWTQRSREKTSKGFSVTELLKRFSDNSSPEAVHAAIDYCADMNLIASFHGWRGDEPFRAFRLTENGEMEVGRNDGKQRRKLTFIEKIGCLIISKWEKQRVYWWVLEKIPAILMRRLSFQFPQFQASMNYFGDTTLLRPTEDVQYCLTWPQFKTDMWEKRKEYDDDTRSDVLVFQLSGRNYAMFKEEIVMDSEIIRVMGAVETLHELIKSRTMGHHIAILIDILSDGVGGATYLENSLKKAIDLMRHRDCLSEKGDYDRVSNEIMNWFRGMEEKISLLLEKREKLIAHASWNIKRLTRQGRGDLAAQLFSSLPFPKGNRIIPSFRALHSMVKRLDHGMKIGNEGIIKEIAKEITLTPAINKASGEESILSQCLDSVVRWAVALSGVPQDIAVYKKARLEVAEGASLRMYVVAYDLIGSSGPEYVGRIGADRDRYIQSVISNWFIAFGGFAQRAEFGGGDLGFGFFQSLRSAVQACLWAGYHLELLKGTNTLLRQEKPHAGFGIVQDELNSGFIGQVKSEWLSKFSKAWKREAERIADKAGRAGLPIVAIHSDMFFGMEEKLPEEWLGLDDQLDKIPVKFIKPAAMTPLPWK